MNAQRPTAATRCKAHSDRAAAWKCESCRKPWCDECIIVRRVGSTQVQVCKQCKGRCVALSPEARGIPQASFSTNIGGAFSYPFKSDKGLGVGIAGVLYWIVLGMIKFAAMVPIIGWLFVGMVVFFLAKYLSTYMIKLINSSADGEEQPPEWSGVEEGNATESLGLICAAGVASFLPLMVYVIFSLFMTTSKLDVGIDVELNLTADPIFWGFLIFGLFYYPMALLSAAIFRSLQALNPVTIIAAIIKVPGSYLLAFGVFGLIFVFGNASENIISLIPYFGSLISSILAFYFLMVELRILGLIYYANRDRLAWF